MNPSVLAIVFGCVVVYYAGTGIADGGKAVYGEAKKPVVAVIHVFHKPKPKPAPPAAPQPQEKANEASCISTRD